MMVPFLCWATLMLFGLFAKSCISFLKVLPLLSLLVMVWVVDVVGGRSFTCRVVFFSSRIAVNLGRLVLWCRTTVQKKLMRLKVGLCLGDHFFFVIGFLCLALWCFLCLDCCPCLFGFVFFVWIGMVVTRGSGLVLVSRGVIDCGLC